MRRPFRFPFVAATTTALALAFTLAATPAAALTLSAGLLHHDNLGPSTGERLRDLAFTTTLARDRARVLARDWQLTSGVALVAEDWFEWSALDRVAPELRAGVRHRFGFGPTAPALRLAAAARYEHTTYALTRGPAATVTLAYAQRLSSGPALQLGVEFERHAASAAVYSGTRAAALARAEFTVSDKLQIALAARHREGDQSAHFRLGQPGFAPGWTNPWRGPVPTPSRFGPGWRAYRFDAATTGLTLRLTHPLGRRTTASASLDYASTRAPTATYLTRLAAVHFAHAF